MVLLVTYINPFVRDPAYGEFVYGGCSLLALVCAFFLPKLKGRNLEELDKVFAGRIPTRKFGDYVSMSTGADVSKAQHIAAESEEATK